MDIATRPGSEVARSLKVLVPLIKADLEKAEQAGMPFCIAAGEKLNEAREGHFDGNSAGFYSWAEKTFDKKRTTIRTWMMAAASASNKPFISLRKSTPTAGGSPPTGPGTRIFREWTAPVDKIAERAWEEQRRLAVADELTRQEERKAEAQLGLRLIDIGWKVLAKEFHSDRPGGSNEAMKRLNRVRDRLKANV